MLKPGSLAKAFRPYWDDMKRCQDANAYWCLLHVTVCLPDIWAALESSDGEARNRRYVAWCDQYLADTVLSGEEWYRMRCAILHQGRTETDGTSPYRFFSFGQPTDTGEIDHGRVEGDILHLDVGELAQITRVGFEHWIQTVEAQPAPSEAANVEKNLASLVRVIKTPTPRVDPAGNRSHFAHCNYALATLLTPQDSLIASFCRAALAFVEQHEISLTNLVKYVTMPGLNVDTARPDSLRPERWPLSCQPVIRHSALRLPRPASL